MRLLVVSAFLGALGMVAIFEAFRAVLLREQSRYKKLRGRFEKTVMPYEALDLHISPLIVHREEWSSHLLASGKFSLMIRERIARSFADALAKNIIPIRVRRTHRGDAWEFHAGLRIRNDREQYLRMKEQGGKFGYDPYMDEDMTEFINEVLYKKGGEL